MKMNKALLVAWVAITSLPASAIMAQPATASVYYQPYATQILLNGQVVSNPSHIIAKEYPTASTTKLAAALAFAQAAGIQPDASGTNPYNDVPSEDWPTIHALTENYVLKDPSGSGVALNMNSSLFNADSSTTFGSDLSVSDFDRAYMIFRGVMPGHDEYLPGGSFTAFSTILGLNNGVSSTGHLSNNDVSTLTANLAKLQKGYVDLGGGKYQLVYSPQSSEFWQAQMPAAMYSQDWENAISIVDKTTVTYAGGVYITQTTGVSDAGYGSSSGNFIEITGGASPEQYSFDGGKSWNTATGPLGYDSLDPDNGGQSTAPSSVLIKDPAAGFVLIAFIYNGTPTIVAVAAALISNGQMGVAYQ